jgi:hypothetical protein
VSLRFGLLCRPQPKRPQCGGALRPSGVVPLGAETARGDNPPRRQPFPAGHIPIKNCRYCIGCCPVSTRHNSSSGTPSDDLSPGGVFRWWPGRAVPLHANRDSSSAAYPQGRFSGCVSVHTGLLRNRSQAQKPRARNRPSYLPSSGCTLRIRLDQIKTGPLSKSEVNGSRLVSNHVSPFREMLMRSAVMFFVLLLWPLSLPSSASAAPLSLYGPFDQKHYGVRSEPASSPAYGSLGLREGPLPRSGNLQICVKGRLSRRPLSTGRALNSKISVGDSGASRGSQSKLRWEETS